jgi:hypothetical protein
MWLPDAYVQGVQVPGPAAVLGQLPVSYSQVTGREVVIEAGTTSLTPEQLALGGVLQIRPESPAAAALAADGVGDKQNPGRGSGGGAAQVIPPSPPATAGQSRPNSRETPHAEPGAPPCPVPEGGAYSLLATAWGMQPGVMQLELPPAPAAAAGKAAGGAAKPGAPAAAKK